MAEKKTDPHTTPEFAARVVGQMLAAAELCFTQHNDATEAMKYTQAALNAANAFTGMQHALTQANARDAKTPALDEQGLVAILGTRIMQANDTLAEHRHMMSAKEVGNLEGQISAYEHIKRCVDPSLAEKRSAALDLKI